MGQREHSKGEEDRNQAKCRSHLLPFQHMLNPEDFSLSSDPCQFDATYGVLSEQPGNQPAKTTAE